jgi:Golgi phosphoprotein 3 (GPP34)
MPHLTGTGRIADDLYLLAHDDTTGKPFLQSRALGIGLAGALLAEQMFAGAIWIHSGQIQIRLHQELPDDDLGRSVLGLLVAERERCHPVRDWLQFLATEAEEQIARRLLLAGYVAKTSSRVLRRRNRWVPSDPDCAFASLIRVKAVMDSRKTATVSDAVLSGLAMACGLGSRILPFGPAEARRNVESSIRNLHPGLRALIGQTQEAVDSALLSHRV